MVSPNTLGIVFTIGSIPIRGTMKKSILCITPYCRNNKTKNSSYCHKCNKRQYRERNPIRSSYTNLKCNSKRRGIEFSLTFEEFEQFCQQTEYIKGVGKKKDSYSIDRIDPTKGYTIDNIQVLTLSENSKKAKLFMYDYQTKYGIVVTLHTPKLPKEGEDLF